MQTSKEIVRSAIEFSTPERLPVVFPCYGNSDVRHVGWNQLGTGDNSKKHTYDDWGCGWERSDVKNMGQVTYHPLSDWSAADGFAWPNPDDPKYYEGMEDRFAGTDGYYIKTDIFMLLFERMHSLRGYEETLCDLYLEQERIGRLADRIVDFDIRVIENIAGRFPGQIDGFSFTDDWGTELSLMIDPLLWRDFFKPRYKRIFAAIHAAGWHVWMHSCGKVNDIIGDLVDIGCNVMNLQQPRLLGIEDVGAQFAGKMCFETLCDIQHTIPFESDEYIEAEAKRLLACWATDTGGFIFSDYGDNAAIGVAEDKKKVMYDAFLRHDRWR